MKYDLEDRLINFAVDIITLSRIVSIDSAGKYLANQILRSGTSPALNYSESKAAESRKDFIHKLKIVLKELRETNSSLIIIQRSIKLHDYTLLDRLQNENLELIYIFVKCIKTTQLRH